MFKRKKSFFRPEFFFTGMLVVGLSSSSSAMTLPDSTEGSIRLTADFHYGFVIAHRPLLVPLQQSHVTGFDVQVGFPTHGKRSYEKIYDYPTPGINYSYFALGDRLHLGHGHALYGFMLFPVTRNPGMQLNIRYGVGVGYVDKTFDRLNNYKNQALASHFNAIFAVHASLWVKLASRIFMQAAVGVTHFSNGSIEIPNLGINIATLSSGFSYFIGEKKKIDRSPADFKLKKWHGSMMLAGAVKKVYPPGGPRYLAGSISLLESVRVKQKSAFGAMLDLFYDNSIHARLKQDSITYNGSADQLRMGMGGSYELIVSNFSLLLQIGGYLHTRLKTDGTIYSRFGIRYAVAKNYFVCFNLKTHFAKADFFEWGGGIKF